MDPCARRTRAKKWLPAVVGYVLLLLYAPVVPAPPAHAQGAAAPGPRLAPLDPQLPWTIEADHMRYDQARDEYIAEGNVLIAKMDRSISADLIRYNQKTMMVYAQGNVTLTAGTDVLSGSYLELDLESEKGYLDDGVVFLSENNYYIKADRIQKIGGDLYSIDRGIITTCDGDPPDWKISGNDIKVHDDGSGSAWNALVYTRDVPMMYFPYVSFPARNKRQTGFLAPEFGYTERTGAFYNQPFFWAIDDQTDATFYLEYMSKRGVRPGLEYRYYLTQEAKGAFLFDFMDDEQNDHGGDSSENWGYDTAGLRPNHDRWWLRMSHDNPLPYDAFGRLELDLVSDQDYLLLFKKGYMGWQESSVFFNKFFGRVLDDYDDPVRTNRLQVTKSWQSFSLDAGTLVYVDSTKGADWKDQTQRLPVVRFTAPKQRVAESPFMYNLSSEYDNFWQERGYGVQRGDLWPRLYYPYALAPYLTIEPSVGWRETVWDQYKTEDADPWSDKSYFHRELYDMRVVLSTDFYKVYDVAGESVQKIKHRVFPELIHTYVSEADQDSLPNVDSRDRIENRNRISYSLTNFLTSKFLKSPVAKVDRSTVDEGYSRVPSAESPMPSTSSDEYVYLDFFRLKVGQYYDFARHEEPFGPVLSKLTVNPGEKIKLDMEAAYNTYSNLLDRYNASVTLGAKKQDHLFISYRYDRDTTEDEKNDEYDIGQIIEPQKIVQEQQINSLYTQARLGLTERFSLLASYERDFVNADTPSYGFGFIYESQCWTLETVFEYEEENPGVSVRIRLHGIGDFGL
jgi:LPS-assembly protein